MSMDLEVWSSERLQLPASLPRSSDWQRLGDEFSFQGEGWLVNVLTEPGSPDESVAEALPDAAYVAYVTLEPIGADAAGYEFFEQVVRSLARQSDGVWLDSEGIPRRHDQGSFD